MRKHLKFILPSVSMSMTCVYGGAIAMQQQENIQDPHSYSKQQQRPSSSAAVFLASPAYTFDMFFTALILQPTGSYLHYAAEADPLPLPSPNWKIFDISTDYEFGFDVGIGGVFHSTSTTLTLDWERFHNDDSSHKKVSSNDMIGPFFEIGPDAAPYNKSRGHVNFHFDQVNLDYGQYVNFGDRLRTNLYAGLGFTRIKQTLLSKFSNETGGISRTIKAPSKFIGAGPQVGIDFTYRIVAGFQFVGQTTASLFVGNLRNHTTYKSESPLLGTLGIESPNKQSTKVHQRTQVVPGFEGQLGLAYAYNFCRHYMFKVEAGYEAQIYLNAIQSVDMGSEVIDLPVPDASVGVFARSFQRVLSNFALAGPYVKVELAF